MKLGCKKAILSISLSVNLLLGAALAYFAIAARREMIVRTQIDALELLVTGAASDDPDVLPLSELVKTGARAGSFDPVNLRLEVGGSTVQNQWGDQFFLVRSIDGRRAFLHIERKRRDEGDSS